VTDETLDETLEEAAEAAAPFLPQIGRQVRPALVGFLVMTLICGVLYPAALYEVAHWAFPWQADGSLVIKAGVVRGSALIGEPFARPEYFQPRPSAAGNGYDATQSGGTNLAPGNAKLITAVTAAADAYRKLNGLAADAAVPIDAVTSSGSGLDPDISLANAGFQAPRVARARGLSVDVVRGLIADHSRGRDLGLFGQPRVSVLELNLALDRAGRGGP